MSLTAKAHQTRLYSAANGDTTLDATSVPSWSVGTFVVTQVMVADATTGSLIHGGVTKLALVCSAVWADSLNIIPGLALKIDSTNTLIIRATGAASHVYVTGYWE